MSGIGHQIDTFRALRAADRRLDPAAGRLGRRTALLLPVGGSTASGCGSAATDARGRRRGVARPGALARAGRGRCRRDRRWRPTMPAAWMSGPACRSASRAATASCSTAASAPFHDRLARPATSAEVGAWLAGHRAPPRAARRRAPCRWSTDVPFGLDAGGFDRHTFLCGQSGSGKSYCAWASCSSSCCWRPTCGSSILDPNSDFVRLARGPRRRRRRPAERWRALAGGIRVRAATAAGDARLRLRFAELGRGDAGRAAAARPLADREEYAELAALLAGDGPRASRSWRPPTVPRPGALDCGVANLGVEDLGVWARDDAGSLLDDARRSRRALPRGRPRLAAHARGAGARRRVGAARPVGSPRSTAARCWSSRRGPQRLPGHARTIR